MLTQKHKVGDVVYYCCGEWHGASILHRTTITSFDENTFFTVDCTSLRFNEEGKLPDANQRIENKGIELFEVTPALDQEYRRRENLFLILNTAEGYGDFSFYHFSDEALESIGNVIRSEISRVPER